jgi:hypothetical protein
LFAFAAQIAVAQPPATLPEFVKELDAPEAQARLDATESLFQAGTITLKDMEKALREGKLSPEQRQRLLSVAARRFRTEPRAAMGIQNDGNLGSHGVSLALVQNEFPASKVLRVGDRVIAAAGTTIDTWETMRAVIVSRDPGDEIPVTVVREGATLNLTVTLGDFTRLRQPNIDLGILGDAWRLRSKGLSDPEADRSPPIASDLPATAWVNQFGLLPDEAAELGMAGARPDDGAVALVAGGEPRGGVQGVIQPPQAQRGFNIRQFPGQPRPANPGNVDPVVLGLQQQLLALKSLIMDLRAEQVSVTQQLSDPALDAKHRQDLRARLDMLTQQIPKLTAEATRIENQISPRTTR